MTKNIYIIIHRPERYIDNPDNDTNIKLTIGKYEINDLTKNLSIHR